MSRFDLAGRPFAMELLNPHRSRLNKAEMKQLQEVVSINSLPDTIIHLTNLTHNTLLSKSEPVSMHIFNLHIRKSEH